ncbi:MAG TPA: tyrosine--tRNA ligase [Verrucomicrobiae bacterium]
MSIIEELTWRGLVADCTDAAELEKKLAKPITLYCGFDPTADSLHIGNLVPLIALRRFQLLGHHPIAVAGGATGSIGDPSWKAQERPLLTKDVLDRNIASVKVQLAKLLDFESQKNPARLMDNASWIQNIPYLDFLRDIGKHFSVNQMVAKESIRARMADREAGISYTEFSYMLIQAFDFHVLARDFNCELQIGGSDQWGNITPGIELCRKKLGKTVFGLTLPLIMNADGTKFGKTEKGAIWLDVNRTSVEDFYQFWIRTDDRDVIRHLKFLTFLSRKEIEDLEKQHQAKPESRIAHQALAKELRNLIHPSTAGVAERTSKILFETLFENYTSDDWEFLTKHSHSIEVEKTKLVGMPLVELLVLADLSSSKGQARKDIEGRGISINNHPPLPNFGCHIQASDLQLGKYLRIRKGKKNYVVVTAK